MKTKHTPGPWRFGPSSTHPETIVIGNENWTTTIGLVDGYCIERMEANAHLIAAAPELLDACKYVRDTIMDDLDYPHDLRKARIVEFVKAAISKAEGK